MKRILFQGDSITDCGRNRESFYSLGGGYANLVGCYLCGEYPGQYECINKGISGNRIVDVYARIKKDIINLEPDMMSIMIGVNDVWHEVNHQNGVSTEKYELLYEMMLREIQEALPDIKIMIIGPYVIKGTATEEKWEEFRSGVEEKAAAAKRIAEKFGLPFVDMLTRFDEAVAQYPDGDWATEGVHAKNAGKELLKRAWLECFEENFVE
ncbi:MAG: SGNH/GDSL hydrolase family protein [Clostridia bacterium]|nr:SGNH/GDSL hydrolase family protein [Clostridia bacterium]